MLMKNYLLLENDAVQSGTQTSQCGVVVAEDLNSQPVLSVFRRDS